MPFSTQSTPLTVRLAGTIAFLLSMGLLGTSAPAQDKGKTTESKDQAKPALKADSVKKTEEKKEEKKAPPPIKPGLSINDPRALQGYTLMSPFVSPNTYLLDMHGKVVHTWKTDSSPALSAFLLENGHLMRPGSIGGDANVFGPGPGVGGRIQEFNWDGELVWDFKFYNAKQLPHHDMTRLPNGNVLLVVWDRKTTEETLAAGRRPEMTGDKHFLPDSLIEVKPTGKTTGVVVWEWHLWDHLVQDFDKTKKNYGDVAAHPELVNINYGEDELASAKGSKDGKDKDAKDKETKDKDAKPKDPKDKEFKDKGAKKTETKDKDGKEKAKADQPKGATPPITPRVDPDFTHVNGVAYNADLDQISISVWKFSEFWIIDHSTTTAEAARHKGGRSGKGGDLLYRWGNPRAYRAGTKADQKLFSQHNAHWIPKGLAGAGNILLFNNGVGRPGGNHSTVDELVLPVDSQGQYILKPGTAYGPDQALWSYVAPTKEEFFSSFISGAQRLSNGNTLICSGASGTVFEVTPEKELVWKYVNPARNTPFGAPPKLGQLLTPTAGELLAVSPLQRVHFDELQKDVDARLDKLLTDEQKKVAAEPDANAGGFGFARPGLVLAPAVVNRLNLTYDQRADVTALQKAIESRFEGVLNDAQKKQLKSVFSGFTPAPFIPKLDGPGKVLTAAQQDTLDLSPDQRKRMAEIQKEIDAKLDTLLTEEQRRQLQAMRLAPPTGGKTVTAAAPAVIPAGNSPLFRAYRYGTDHPAFAGKTLTPGKTLEELQAKEPEKKVTETKK